MVIKFLQIMWDEEDQPIPPDRDHDINEDIELVTRHDFRKIQENVVESMTTVTTLGLLTDSIGISES